MDWEEAVLRGLNIVLPVWLCSGGILGLLIAGAYLVLGRPLVEQAPKRIERKEKDHA